MRSRRFATIGYIAQSSGGCALEPSYSFFSITVTGKTASGKPIAAVGRIYFGQDRSGDDYGAFCDGPFVNTTCQKTADRELVLTASTN
jgi:hypothetical protein